MRTFIFAALAVIYSCSAQQPASVKTNINSTLDQWHAAAGQAKFDAYFDMLTSDAIYIGTDATENWTVQEFKAFAKPYFDRGKAWNFTAVQRNIYIINDDCAYFDELLDTQMKICRGSGVMRKVGKQWKIAHYVLSMTVPNDNSAAVIAIKAPIEDALLTTLKSTKK